MRLKSLKVRPRPMPSMVIPSAGASKSLLNQEKLEGWKMPKTAAATTHTGNKLVTTVAILSMDDGMMVELDGEEAIAVEVLPAGTLARR
jgi:hypothetical protein